MSLWSSSYRGYQEHHNRGWLIRKNAYPNGRARLADALQRGDGVYNLSALAKCFTSAKALLRQPKKRKFRG